MKQGPPAVVGAASSTRGRRKYVSRDRCEQKRLGLPEMVTFGIAKALLDGTAVGVFRVATLRTVAARGRRSVFSGSDHSIIYPLGLPGEDVFWNRRINTIRYVSWLLEYRFSGRWTSSPRVGPGGTSLFESPVISGEPRMVQLTIARPAEVGFAFY